MTHVNHHVSDTVLQSYSTGHLPHHYAVVVAAHISFCTSCRASFEANEAVGGELLEAADDDFAPVDHLRARVLAALDDEMPLAPRPTPHPIYPNAVIEALKGRSPKWRKLGPGIEQSIISNGPEGSVRLLKIQGGKAVPEHSHGGLELTLVLSGSFSDDTGHYQKGDLQEATGELDHQPIADPGHECICLAATDAPLRFKDFLPRMLQPIFKI